MDVYFQLRLELEEEDLVVVTETATDFDRWRVLHKAWHTPCKAILLTGVSVQNRMSGGARRKFLQLQMAVFITQPHQRGTILTLLLTYKLALRSARTVCQQTNHPHLQNYFQFSLTLKLRSKQTLGLKVLLIKLYSHDFVRYLFMFKRKNSRLKPKNGV